MQRIPDLIGVAPNHVFETNTFDQVRLHGHLRPPYTDNRNLEPHLQVWDLLMNMFESARGRFGDRSVPYILRMGSGVQGANRYNFSMKGLLQTNPDETSFFGRIEKMMDSNDSLDIRDIHLVLEFLE